MEFFIPDTSPFFSYSDQWTAAYHRTANGKDQTFHQSNSTESVISFNISATSLHFLTSLSDSGSACDSLYSVDSAGWVSGCEAEGLKEGRHNVVLKGSGAGTVQFYGIKGIRQSRNSTIDNLSPSFQYSGDWTHVRRDGPIGESKDETIIQNTQDKSGFFNNSISGSSQAGSKAELKFKGESIYLYGISGPFGGSASIKLNGEFQGQVNLSLPWKGYSLLLFTASGLDVESDHSVEVENLFAGQSLLLDYAIITASPLSSSSTNETAIIAGVAAGLVTLLITLLAFYFLYYRQRRSTHYPKSKSVSSKDTFHGKQNPINYWRQNTVSNMKEDPGSPISPVILAYPQYDVHRNVGEGYDEDVREGSTTRLFYYEQSEAGYSEGSGRSTRTRKSSKSRKTGYSDYTGPTEHSHQTVSSRSKSMGRNEIILEEAIIYSKRRPTTEYSDYLPYDGPIEMAPTPRGIGTRANMNRGDVPDIVGVSANANHWIKARDDEGAWAGRLEESRHLGGRDQDVSVGDNNDRTPSTRPKDLSRPFSGTRHSLEIRYPPSTLIPNDQRRMTKVQEMGNNEYTPFPEYTVEDYHYSQPTGYTSNSRRRESVIPPSTARSMISVDDATIGMAARINPTMRNVNGRGGTPSFQTASIIPMRSLNGSTRRTPSPASQTGRLTPAQQYKNQISPSILSSSASSSTLPRSPQLQTSSAGNLAPNPYVQYLPPKSSRSSSLQSAALPSSNISAQSSPSPGLRRGVSVKSVKTVKSFFSSFFSNDDDAPPAVPGVPPGAYQHARPDSDIFGETSFTRYGSRETTNYGMRSMEEINERQKSKGMMGRRPGQLRSDERDEVDDLVFDGNMIIELTPNSPLTASVRPMNRF